MKYKLLMLLFLLLIMVSGCVLDQQDTEEDPALKVDTSALYFGKTLSENTFNITNSGGGTLSWWVEIDDTIDWIDVTPDAGNGKTKLTVSVDRSKLSAGEHSSELAVHSSGGDTTITIHVIVENEGIIVIHGDVPPQEGEL